LAILQQTQRWPQILLAAATVREAGFRAGEAFLLGLADFKTKHAGIFTVPQLVGDPERMLFPSSV
jgi:hypothetical protein